MNIGGWVGGGVAGTGSAMQFMAQRKREKAQNRVSGKMKKEATRFGAERYDVSETLRKALDSIAQERIGNTQSYFENRNSPQRQLEAEREQHERVAASQSGLNKAMEALNGPSNAYRGPDSVMTPGQTVTPPGPTGMNPASPLDTANQVYGQREQPMLQGIMAQLANQGFLEGGAQFDTGNQQALALNQRPLDNESMLRQLLLGVRQGEAQFVHDNQMSALQRAMEAANRVGATEMLWGSILQNIGTGIAGGSNFQYSSPNGANDPTGGANGAGGLYGNPGTPVGGGYTTGDPGAGDLPGLNPDVMAA